MSENLNQNHDLFYNLKIVHKWMLITALMVGIIVTLLAFVFPERLAQERLEQMRQMGYSQTLLVADIALESLANRDVAMINRSLTHLEEEVISKEAGLFEISIILHPDGVFYASTNPGYVGQRAHESLLSKLSGSLESNIQFSKIHYRSQGKTLPTYQFMKDVVVESEGKTFKVATAQVLLGYGQIIQEVRNNVLIIGLWALVVSLGLVWVFSIPVSLALTKIREGMEAIGKKNFNYHFDPETNDEIGQVLHGFNRMNKSLNSLYQENQSLSAKALEQEPTNPANALDGATLRKADLTCLCARIPSLQSQIHVESPETIVSNIQAFMANFTRKVTNNGGQVVKVLGDKVYCLFEGMNGINNAITAAVQINQVWKELNHERRVLNKELYDYGMGLHSAEGIAGNVGHGAGSYTFVGDSAKYAAYLCSCSKPGEILITAGMLEKAQHSYKNYVIEEVRAKILTSTDEIFCITESMPVGDEEALQQRSKAGAAAPKAKSTDLKENGIPNMLEETLESSPLELNIEEDKDTDFGEVTNGVNDIFDGLPDTDLNPPKKS